MKVTIELTDSVLEAIAEQEALEHAYVYKRDKETLKITKRGIGHVRYDIIEDKFWDGYGPSYDEFVCYKTYEECAKKSKIEVVTFK